MLLVGLALAACGGKKQDDGPPAGDDKPTVAEARSGYCMLPNQRCWEFTDDSQAAMTSMCNHRGTFVANQPCPKANQIGSCRAGKMLTRFYSGEIPGNCGACPDGKVPPWSAESIATECKESMGKLE